MKREQKFSPKKFSGTFEIPCRLFSVATYETDPYTVAAAVNAAGIAFDYRQKLIRLHQEAFFEHMQLGDSGYQLNKIINVFPHCYEDCDGLVLDVQSHVDFEKDVLTFVINALVETQKAKETFYNMVDDLVAFVLRHTSLRNWKQKIDFEMKSMNKTYNVVVNYVSYYNDVEKEHDGLKTRRVGNSWDTTLNGEFCTSTTGSFMVFL